MWKMSFNLDPTKQAQEVIVSKRTTRKIHSKIFFNNIQSVKPIFKNIWICI